MRILVPFMLLSAAVCPLGFQPAAEAQSFQCDEGFILLDDAIVLHLEGEALTAAAAREPLAVAPAMQLGAPGENGGGTSLVTRPGFPSLLGLAYESGLVQEEDGVTTVSLTPFSFLALMRPEYSSEQALYATPLARRLRQLGGSVSLGGKGDSFDQDGDGTSDDALEADELDDIVTWEARWQFGSRDRRDKGSFKIFDEELRHSKAFDRSTINFGELIVALNPLLDPLPRGLKSDRCFRPDDLAMVFVQEQAAKEFAEQRLADESYEAAAKRAFDKVDRRPILTLVYGGTERKEQFGSDKRLVALRGASGVQNLGGSHAVELSWSTVESLLGASDAETWKLGYEFSRLFLKGSSIAKDGVVLGVSGSYEILDNVPTAKHDDVGKLNAKLSIPVGEGVSVPISVTWANHKDLVTDEDELRGHIGFTVDFSRIQEIILGRQAASGSANP